MTLTTDSEDLTSAPALAPADDSSFSPVSTAGLSRDSSAQQDFPLPEFGANLTPPASPVAFDDSADTYFQGLNTATPAQQATLAHASGLFAQANHFDQLFTDPSYWRSIVERPEMQAALPYLPGPNPVESAAVSAYLGFLTGLDPIPPVAQPILRDTYAQRYLGQSPVTDAQFLDLVRQQNEQTTPLPKPDASPAPWIPPAPPIPRPDPNQPPAPPNPAPPEPSSIGRPPPEHPRWGDKAYQIRQNKLVFNPAEFPRGVDEAVADGYIDAATGDKLKASAPTVQASFDQWQQMSKEAETNSAMKALLYGVGKGAVMTATGLGTGFLTTGAASETTVLAPVAGTIVGLTAAHGAGVAYDAAARKLADYNSNFRNVLEAVQLHPNYELAGEFSTLVLELPLGAARLLSATRAIARADGPRAAAKYVAAVAGTGAVTNAAADTGARLLEGELGFPDVELPSWKTAASAALFGLLPGGVLVGGKRYSVHDLQKIQARMQLGQEVTPAEKQAVEVALHSLAAARQKFPDHPVEDISVDQLSHAGNPAQAQAEVDLGKPRLNEETPRTLTEESIQERIGEDENTSHRKDETPEAEAKRLHWLKYTFGAPAIRVEGNGPFVRERIGIELSDAQLSDLAGADRNSTVIVRESKYPNAIELEVHSPGVEVQKRLIARNENGDLFIYNEHFKKVKTTPRGYGAFSLAIQVRRAISIGCKYIETYAAGDFKQASGEGYNGYNTWARYGFEAPLSAEDTAKLPNFLQGAKTVSDVVKTAAGRTWWEVNGSPKFMYFDLSPDSLSLTSLEAYFIENNYSLSRHD